MKNKKTKVLVFGWEFPPYNVGGLGVACHGLTKSMVKFGLDLTFVIPKAPNNAKNKFLNLLVADRIHVNNKIDCFEKQGMKIKTIDSLLMPYMNEEKYESLFRYFEKNNIKAEEFFYTDSGDGFSFDAQYGVNLFEEVWRYANKAEVIARKEDFDIIHAHDWMTFRAGIVAKRVSGKPLVIHIHNTAFDRSGGNPSQEEYKIEKEGFEKADKIIAISYYVKRQLLKNYGIDESKIVVVHNGIDVDEYCFKPTKKNINDKIVLYAGRVTLQKGPEYFVKAAKKVCDLRDDVIFVLAGGGDMLVDVIDLVARLGISDRFVFTGRYAKEDGERLMSMADVFVMPSVSEPFGLVPLEAMLQKTSVIISKQSGVSEVLENALKVDFWDIDSLSNQIASLLEYDALRNHLSENGEKEVKLLNWDPAALKCKRVFEELIYKNAFNLNY